MYYVDKKKNEEEKACKMWVDLVGYRPVWFSVVTKNICICSIINVNNC